MQLILAVGMTGQGKTHFVTEAAIKDKACLVFDVNNEYEYLPTNQPKAIQSRFVGDYKEFLEIVAQKRNTNIVFEEATGFFAGAVSKDVKKLIINKRHTKNNYFFIFHSWRSVPPGIFDLVNYCKVFKTNDNPDLVLKKYPQIYTAWVEVMRTDKRYVSKLVPLIQN